MALPGVCPQPQRCKNETLIQYYSFHPSFGLSDFCLVLITFGTFTQPFKYFFPEFIIVICQRDHLLQGILSLLEVELSNDIQFKLFRWLNIPINKVKRQTLSWGKYICHVYDRQRVNFQLLQIVKKKTKHPIEKCSQGKNRLIEE